MRERCSDEDGDLKTALDLKSEKGLPEIARDLECLKGFSCYQSGFKDLCKARDIGINTFLECLEKDANECMFSFQLDVSFLCECPLRIYIAKNLKK